MGMVDVANNSMQGICSRKNAHINFKSEMLTRGIQIGCVSTYVKGSLISEGIPALEKIAKMFLNFSI